MLKASDKVIDFGCRTGILSFFASDVGASKVYAIDQSEFILMARKIALINQYHNIKFFYGNESDFELSDKVDVIISEWMGQFAFNECMFEPLIELRDRYLKDGGRMIPSDISLFAGLVTDQWIYDYLSYFRTNPYGINFSYLKEWFFNQTYARHLKPDQVLKQTLPLTTFDMLSIQGIPKLSSTVIIEKPTTVYAVCGWFNARLSENISIKTGPFDPKTHWKQIIFPLNSPLKLTAGEELSITIQPILSHNKKSKLWRWIITSQNERYDMNDFFYEGWLQKDLHYGFLDKQCENKNV